MTKLKIVDQELKAGTEELYGKVQEALGHKGKGSDNEMDADDKDDSFETVSEEDISDEDDAMKD